MEQKIFKHNKLIDVIFYKVLDERTSFDEGLVTIFKKPNHYSIKNLFYSLEQRLDEVMDPPHFPNIFPLKLCLGQ